MAAGVPILRFRLYEIDRRINRTLVYGCLTSILALVYWSGVAVLEDVLRPLTGSSDLAIVGSTLLVAATSSRFGTSFRWWIDRQFYHRRYDAVRTLEAFGVHPVRDVDLNAPVPSLSW